MLSQELITWRVGQASALIIFDWFGPDRIAPPILANFRRYPSRLACVNFSHVDILRQINRSHGPVSISTVAVESHESNTIAVASPPRPTRSPVAVSQFRANCAFEDLKLIPSQPSSPPVCQYSPATDLKRASFHVAFIHLTFLIVTLSSRSLASSVCATSARCGVSSSPFPRSVVLLGM